MSSRVTSRGGVRPRELPDVDYAASASQQSDVADADQYLVFAVPSSRFYPAAAASAGTGGRKTRVWQCLGGGGGGGGVLTGGSRRDGDGDGPDTERMTIITRHYY